MSDIKQKLKEMAQLSVLAGRISEVQEKNMKNYPFVFFESVDSVRIDYDLGHGINEKTKQVNHKSRVSYYLTLIEEANSHALEKRFKALEASVRYLFWNDVIVEVYFNGKLVYGNKDV